MRITGVPFVQGHNYSRDRNGDPEVTQKVAIAIHNTANDASAKTEADYATRRPDEVSSHFYVDGTQVIQSLDTDWRAWHAGSTQGNSNAIAVELVGTNDKPRDWWLANICWDKVGAALAQVCKRYGIPTRRVSVAEMRANPQVKGVYGHDDMRQAWGHTTHTDPGPNFPWDKLLSTVNDHLHPEVPMLDVAGQLPELKEGMRDPVASYCYIWRAQLILGVTADGDYGPKTAAAVKAYAHEQLDRKVDGTTIDAALWQRLLALQSKPAPAKK